MTQNWISRFEIWSYIETFAVDAEKELLAEFQGRPDLIVGNYTDGNLVAFLLSRRLKVTQCNVAHALEKSKYLFSNLVIADRKGMFVQPALFEAFGLTILEAMVSGLPTFGTQFGGPLEIIQDKVNGFYINPTNLEETASKILDFDTKCTSYPNYCNEIYQAGIDRVYSTYTWKIHVNKLLTLARIYGFWNFTSKEQREDLLRYLESLFYLMYKPRAQQQLEQHQYR